MRRDFCSRDNGLVGSSNCECINIQNAKVTGSFKGTAQMLITEDLGSPTVTHENCVPFHGNVYISTAAAELMRLNVVGEDCDPLMATGTETFHGSFGPSLQRSARPPISTAGLGTLNGVVNPHGVLRMKLKWPITSVSGVVPPHSGTAKITHAATPSWPVSASRVTIE
jgi:hypothetical protein